MKRVISIMAGVAILGTAVLRLAGLGPGAVPSKPSGTVLRPETLASEYSLAREARFYFVLDLGAKKMELKAKGMVMKSWLLRGVKFWGKPGFPEVVEVSRKSALRPPKRFKIKPVSVDRGEEESDPGEYEVDALEVTDMPGGFALLSTEGVRMSVRTRTRSIGSIPGAVMSLISWHAIVPLRHLIRTLRGKPKFAVEITFSEKRDAQEVYWTFFEGIKGIIY
jgi:hypothetical protein